MALAHDANTRFPSTATTDTTAGDRTFTHTPAGTPAGVVLVLCCTGLSPVVTGALYGGAAMTLATSATDTSEAGLIQVYTLTDTTVPTGAQTVTLQNCSATAKWCTVSTVTATAGQTTVNSSAGKNTTTATNPSVNVTTTDTTLTYGGLHTGNASPLTVPISGCTLQHNMDYGALAANTLRRTSPDAAGSIGLGFTFATSDDYCMAAVSLAESSANLNRAAADTSVSTDVAGRTSARTRAAADTSASGDSATGSVAQAGVPNLVASYYVPSAGTSSATISTPSFTPANGEVLIVKLETWDTGVSMGSVTGGSQTYTSRVTVAPGGFRPWVGIYSATVAGSPGPMTVSATPSAASRYSMVVERWTNAQLAGTPVTGSASGQTGAANASLTTTTPNSIVSWVAGDSQSLDPATRAYLNSAVQDGLRDDHVGANGVAYHAYQLAATAGSQAFGLSAPAGGMAYCIAGIEVLSNAGTSGTQRAAADTSASTDTAVRGAQAFTRTAAGTSTAGDSAARTSGRVRATTDSAASSDAAVRGAAIHPRSAPTTTVATDAVARTSARVRATADSSSASDAASRSVATTRAAADASASADSATGAAPPQPRSAADTSASTDVATRSALAYVRTAGDSAAAGDGVTRSSARTRAAADTSLSTDTAVKSQGRLRTAADSSVSTDAAVRLRLLIRAVPGTQAATDAAVRGALVLSRFAIDGALSADVAERNQTEPTLIGTPVVSGDRGPGGVTGLGGVTSLSDDIDRGAVTGDRVPAEVTGHAGTATFI